MKTAAASAALTFSGNWFDIDGNALTGKDAVRRRSTAPHRASSPIPATENTETLSAARDEVIWINADCRREIELFIDRSCPQGNTSFAEFQTGVNGRERQVNLARRIRAAARPSCAHPRGSKVTLLWDNRSEVTPDASTLEYDFEGYRIWRADGWDASVRHLDSHRALRATSGSSSRRGIS